MITISDFRPDSIIMAYWKEILDVHEDDEILAVEFVEG